jgi:hypothetical protein
VLISLNRLVIYSGKEMMALGLSWWDCDMEKLGMRGFGDKYV